MPFGSYWRQMYITRVALFRPGSGTVMEDGAPDYSWEFSTDLIDPVLGVPGQFMCRLDLQFIRPGSVQPMAIEAGVAIPRVGTLFFDVPNEPDFVRAGDRVITVKSPGHSYPVHGVFELRIPPEPALDLLGASHMEVQVVESNIKVGKFPGIEPSDVTD
jgi:hypothetical protein